MRAVQQISVSVRRLLAQEKIVLNSLFISADVEARGNFAARGMTAGNEQRRWHGTKRKCTLGDMGQAKLCGDTTCCLCNIIKTSFDLTAFGKNTGWGRWALH